MDPKSIWDETFSVLKEILGIAPKGQSLLKPQPLQRVPNSQQLMDMARLARNREALDRPGAVVFDTLPIDEPTDEERARIEEEARQKYTYRRPPRVDLPAGVMIAGPERDTRRR